MEKESGARFLAFSIYIFKYLSEYDLLVVTFNDESLYETQ